MRKIKDFMYNCSDIFVTLIVLALAGGIIFWRLQVILAYSEYKAASNPHTEKVLDIDFSDIDLTPADEKETENEPEVLPQEPEELVIDENYKSSKDITVKIQFGDDYNHVIRLVVEAYGFEDDDYVTLYNLLWSKGIDLGADYRIQSGLFTIPAGSDIDQIIRSISGM